MNTKQARSFVARVAPLALALAVAGVCASCSGGSAGSGPSVSPRYAPHRSVDTDDASLPAGDTASLWPDSLRVHSLTRIEPGDGTPGSEEIVCHVELLDRHGHNTKALGVLRVELYRLSGAGTGAPAGGPGAEGTQELVWVADLTDPDDNALRYDNLVSRSYVVHLGGVPEWLLRRNGNARGEGADGSGAGAPGGAGGVLKVYFTYREPTGAAGGGAGRTRVLQDLYRLNR